MKIKENIGLILACSLKFALKSALALVVVAGGFFIFSHQTFACSVSFRATPGGSATINSSCLNPNGFDLVNASYSGGMAIDWTSSSGGWLVVSPTSGNNLSAGNSTPVNLSVPNAPTTPGSYSATVTISAVIHGTTQPAQSSPQSFTVNLSVSSPSCTINIATTYNGAASVPPGGYGYSLTGSGSSSGTIHSTPYSFATSNIGNWNLSVSNPSGITSTVSPPSQTCTQGQLITFNVAMQDVQPNQPGPPTASNSSCGQIQISWSAPSGGSAYSRYYLYASTNPASPYDSGNPWIDTNSTNTSYTYNASTTTAFYYWVAAHSNTTGLTSTLSGPSSPAVEASTCGADFTNSNKIIYSVNGTGYPYSAPVNCGGSNSSGTLPRSYKGNDTIIWYINLCNYGNIDSTSLSLNDTMTNVSPSGGSPYAISINGSGFTAINPSSKSCSGTTCNISFNLSGIKQSQSSVLRITSTLNPTTVQSISRFRNQASFIFSTSQAPNNLGCVGLGENSFNYSCTVSDPGWIPYHGSPAATQQEVSP